MVIKNQTKDSILSKNTIVANTFLTRLKGLLGSAPLKAGEGLLLVNEKSIHTLFMSFSIDVVYIDEFLGIIKIDINMSPWRLGKYITKSAYILELPVGTVHETNTSIGDQLVFEPAL